MGFWKKIWYIIFTIFIGLQVCAQDSLVNDSKDKSLMRDTLDGKFDFSRFLLEANGFIPIPLVITEPALGNIGGALALTFFTPKKVPPGSGYVPPDITAAFGMYTANGTWATGGGRIGSIPKAGIKYRAFAGYASLNLDLFRDVPGVGEKQFGFNFKAAPVLLNFSKEIKKSKVYLGGQYLFANINAKAKFEGEVPEFFPQKEFESRIASFGLFTDIDKRDNFFTPSKGFRVNMMYSMDDDWTGSDYTYNKISGFGNYFFPINHCWTSGLRADVQHVTDGVPFFMYPFIFMRGIPVARYQGKTTALIETEQRYDFNMRWSGVAFGGLGKALWDNQSFSDANLLYAYGAGFRYLVARAFGIRAGIDVAGGPDSFGWYIVFGHNWNR
jgi:hypothetical protein